MYKCFKPEQFIIKDKNIEKMIKANNGKKNEQIKSTQMSNIGVTHDSKKDAYKMKANIFIKYALTRVIARENDEGIWFYNFVTKMYENLSEDKYKKIFFTIINRVSADIWDVSMEKKYVAYFKKIVKQFPTDGNTAGILQFDNCLIDFNGEEVKVLELSPEYYCNYHIPYSYDEDAKCEKFMKFLNEIFENDQQRIDLIQEIMGACLYYEKCAQNLVVFLGNGANGKSVLASTIKHMLGEKNVSSIAIDQLSGNRFSKQNLDKKLLNISSEVNVNKIYSTSDIKTLTGGDSVEIEQKFKNSYTAEIYCKYILLANDMIQTDDCSEGFYRRLIIIPFNVHFLDPVPGKEEEGKHYKNHFIESEMMDELPGIFNFALEGYYRLWDNGYIFSKPDACEEALEQFKKEHNKVKAFVSDRIDIVGTAGKDYIASSAIYDEFESYCRHNRFRERISRKEFHKLLKQMIETEGLDIQKIKRSNGEIYKGMKFKD